MGVEELTRALSIAQSDETADFGDGASPDEIEAAEEYLGIKFPASYREFLRLVGWCSFGGREFYGITPGGVGATSVPSVTFATQAERVRGLPRTYILIEDSGGDEQFVLGSGAPDDRDSPVEVWRPGTKDKGLTVAPDFGSYLLQAAIEANQ